MSVKPGDKCRHPKVIDEHGHFSGCMKCDACTTAIREILERIVSKNRHLQHEKRVWEDRISQIRELTSPGIHGPLFTRGNEDEFGTNCGDS